MDRRDRVHRIGFTATHGLEHADKGPYFLWLNGKCNNALTLNYPHAKDVWDSLTYSGQLR